MSRTIIHNIKSLYTFKHTNVPVKRDDLDCVEVINNAYVIIENDRIVALGSGDFNHFLSDDAYVVDACQKIALPGLIDSHTHLVHGGSRQHEYKLKLQGVEYLEILKQGGGIINTVMATRNSSHQELFDRGYQSLEMMLHHGVTTIEAKTGYGLDFENELKQYEVACDLDQKHPIDIVQTFMPAHAIPIEFKHNPDGYVDYIIDELLPKFTNKITYFDIFIESGVFNFAQCDKILNAAKQLGYQVRIHADEVNRLGGIDLALKYQAISAEHLMATNEEDIIRLGQTNIMANLLPATTFNLSKPYAKAKLMVEHGVGITIATDYNPGSCPCENLQLAMQIGSRGYGLTPTQVYNATTINASCSINKQNEIGSIEINKQADIILMDAPDLEYTIYHFGINHVTDVFKKGCHVIENRQRK